MKKYVYIVSICGVNHRLETFFDIKNLVFNDTPDISDIKKVFDAMIDHHEDSKYLKKAYLNVLKSKMPSRDQLDILLSDTNKNPSQDIFLMSISRIVPLGPNGHLQFIISKCEVYNAG